MSLYCGIDLHANNNYVAILDGKLGTVVEKRCRNDLGEVLGVLEPYRQELESIAVESTWNWYWLVDGLMDAAYRVRLTNTWAAQQYDGLKYRDDRHDARWLARLQVLGILPEGHIYPKDQRGHRDLLRRRSFLVKKRTSMLLALRGAYECHTGERISSNEVKRWSAEDVEREFIDPATTVGMTSLLESIHVLDDQVETIEKWLLPRARLRKEFRLLETVWGIGRILGLTVMYEVGDIRRFPKVGNFASYCRCVKSDWLSDGKRKGSGNRKNGNPYLSWAFNEAAGFAVRHHEQARRFHQRKKSKTKAVVATSALAHKLARSAYYVMRDQVEFDPVKAFG
jgi:transposase